MALPADFDIDDFVSRVLAEDLGKGGDVTSNATIAEGERFTATMNCREAIVIAGLEIAAAFFRRLDPDVRIELLAKDGDALDPRAELMRLDGKARAMLAAERRRSTRCSICPGSRR
jgi:Nicotinate-nucleotide pyrophosphorylase